MDVSKVTRFEVIDHRKEAFEHGLAGRALVKNDIKIKLSLQDDGRTLKVFMDDKPVDNSDEKGIDNTVTV